MNRQLSRIAGGHLKVWWMTHRSQAPLVVLLLILVVLVGLVGHFDRLDLQEMAEISDARAHAIQREMELLRSLREQEVKALPPTVFIIEARTPDEAYNKLSAVVYQVLEEQAKLNR